MLDFQLRHSTRFPFGYGVISHFHHSNYHGTYDDLLIANLAGLPSILDSLVARSFEPFVPSINRFHCLLAAWQSRRLSYVGIERGGALRLNPII
jgi:hypothetical protein